MFGRRKKQPAPPYDRHGRIPVIRASICTGEQVAGFKDPVTGKFEELVLLRSRSDLEDFLRRYDVNESELKKEW